MELLINNLVIKEYYTNKKNVLPNALAYSSDAVSCLPANVPYAFPETSPRL